MTTDRDKLREAASSAEYHQRRGMLPDAVDALAQSYDDFMADDRFDAWDMLHKIGKRLRELREINRNRASLATTPDQAVMTEREAAIELAYGLLWHMWIDTSDENLKLASDARKALLAAIGKGGQLRGIDAAKMTDARFTGAA